MKEITEKALASRINRKLSHEDEALRKTRGTRDLYDLGEWYVINTYFNRIEYKHIDIEALGWELGVLREFEQVQAA